MRTKYSEEDLFDENKRTFAQNPDYIDGCENTRLIQRMKKPRNGPLSPWSFGCGLKNGGLSDEAADIIKEICSFDYMGASEFEFGALAKAFGKIAQTCANGEMEAFVVNLIGSPEFPFGIGGEYSYEGIQAVGKNHLLEASIIAVAPKKIRPHVEEVLLSLTISEDGRQLLENSHLRDALFCNPEWDKYPTKVCGWIEFDNGFMFFSDETMGRGFCSFFGIEIPGSAKLKVADFSEVNAAMNLVRRMDFVET